MSSYLLPFVSSTDNMSVYALPFYWILCMLPHGVAIAIASENRPLQRWDNRNPRSSDMKAGLRKRLGDAKYAMYERAEAAHYNSLESFPLLTAAVVFGNMAKVPAGELNAFMLANALLRALHQFVYIRTSTKAPTFIRTLVWYLQIGLSVSMILRAGKALY